MVFQFQFSRNKFSGATTVVENNQLAQSISLKSAPTFILVREGKKPLGLVGAQSYSIFQQLYRSCENRKDLQMTKKMCMTYN